MRRLAILAGGVWLSVGGTIALAAVLWRLSVLRPHAAWAAASLAAIGVPLGWLVIAALWRTLRGPRRLAAVGWLLVGTTPLVWLGLFFGDLNLRAHHREPLIVNAPVRIVGLWACSLFELEAWRCYPRSVHGRHVELIDDGQTPNAAGLVAAMDQHIESMAGLVGEPVPEVRFAWVRGSLFGHGGRAVWTWALCAHDDHPAELTELDRHEAAHTLITAVCGPDHDPPFVLAEGWAECQSGSRDEQLVFLARKHAEGSAYPLTELVGSNWYGRGSGPVYWEGGPLVHYLIERYGPRTFLQLYRGVRRTSFLADSERILGRPWAEVEQDFWAWLKAEAEAIAQVTADAEQPEEEHNEDKSTLVFAEAVKSEDWQALVDGYRQASLPAEGLPSKAAFAVDVERTVIDAEEGTSEPYAYQLRACFQRDAFWIMEDFSLNAGRYLMVNGERCADLHRTVDGSLAGEVEGRTGLAVVRREATGLMALFQGVVDPADLLPLDDRRSPSRRTVRIDGIDPPEVAEQGVWRVSCTCSWPEEEGAPTMQYVLELNPSVDWRITRMEYVLPGERQSESTSEYQRVGDALLVKSALTHSRSLKDRGEVIAGYALRELTDAEAKQLRDQVEQVTATGPTRPYSGLRAAFGPIAVLWPATGLVMLARGRRRVSAATSAGTATHSRE